MRCLGSNHSSRYEACVCLLQCMGNEPSLLTKSKTTVERKKSLVQVRFGHGRVAPFSLLLSNCLEVKDVFMGNLDSYDYWYHHHMIKMKYEEGLMRTKEYCSGGDNSDNRGSLGLRSLGSYARSPTQPAQSATTNLLKQLVRDRVIVRSHERVPKEEAQCP